MKKRFASKAAILLTTSLIALGSIGFSSTSYADDPSPNPDPEPSPSPVVDPGASPTPTPTPAPSGGLGRLNLSLANSVGTPGTVACDYVTSGTYPLTGGGGSIPVDPIGTATILAHVSDSLGAPVAGATVSWVGSSLNMTSASSSGVTNSAGDVWLQVYCDSTISPTLHFGYIQYQASCSGYTDSAWVVINLSL